MLDYGTNIVDSSRKYKNMKKQLILFCSILGFLNSSAQIELTSEAYPFNGVMEWQDVGTIITSSDPDQRQRDFNIWLLNKDGEVQWREKFYPKLNRPFPIIGHNSSYIYFLDNLKPESHKINYHQINMSGSVKSTSLDLLAMVKKAGYNSTDELLLVDVINAPGALVFQFDAENKTAKSIDQLLVFLTHHNHRAYLTKTVSTSLDGLKNTTEGRLMYAGSDDEQIYFSRYIRRVNQHTLEFIPYSAKGEEGFAQVFTLDDYTSNSSRLVPLNYTGEYHLQLQAKNTTPLGGFYFGKRFYSFGFNDNLDKWGVCMFDDKGKQKILEEVELSEQKKRKGVPTVVVGEARSYWSIGFDWNEDNCLHLISMDRSRSAEAFLQQQEQLRNNPSVANLANSLGIFVHPTNDGYFRLVLEKLGHANTLNFDK
jgi:hypothetical protein